MSDSSMQEALDEVMNTIASTIEADRAAERESKRPQPPPPKQSLFDYVWSWIIYILDLPNTLFVPYRLHLFEWCDLDITPKFIVHACQDNLTAQWTHRLPLIQSRSPADLASILVQKVVDMLPDSKHSNYTVIDFCSGAGGPTPQIERSVNASRKSQNKPAIPFRLTDINPNLDAWIGHSSRSANLSFIPQPVDAANPPRSVISASRLPKEDSVDNTTSSPSRSSSLGSPIVPSRLRRSRNQASPTTSPTKPSSASSTLQQQSHPKTVHLYTLAFHHFDDPTAKKVLRSTLDNSDAFLIIELQNRSIGSLALLSFEWALLYLVTLFWWMLDTASAGGDGDTEIGALTAWTPRLLFTYIFPVLPAVMTWDGVVSCLRTRTSEEVEALVQEVQDENGRKGGEDGTGQSPKWVLRHAQELHTWPFGYLEAVIGIRT